MRHDRRRQRGQVLIILALAAVVLFGMAALALDIGWGQADRRDLQADADAAALSGARDLTSGTDAADYTAMQYLKKNLNLSNTGSCTGFGVGQCGSGPYNIGGYHITFNATSSKLDVVLTHDRPVFFAGIFGFNSTSAVDGSSARALSAPVSKCVVCILGRTGVTLTIESSGTGIQVPDPAGTGYGVQVNSSSCPANTFNGNSTRITAPGANFVGCALVANNYYTPVGVPFTPVNNVNPVPDPLGAVPEPGFSCCTLRGGTVLSDSGPVTLQPGIYSELHPTNSNIILQPGLYVLTGDGNDPGDGILEDGNGTLLGTGGVTLFFTCSSFKSGKYCGSPPDGTTDPGSNDCTNSPSNGATIVMSSNGNVGITAPSSGPYQGIAIFFDRCNSSTVQMTANGSQSLTGAFYAKSSQVQLTSSASQVVVNGAFIAKTVDLQSNAGIRVSYDPTNPAQNNPQAFSGSGWQPSPAQLAR